MSDQFNVALTLDKPAGYNTGDKITITLSGSDVQTVTETDTVTVGVVAADGATGSTTTPVTLTKVTPESVKIQTVTSSLGVVYTISPDGLSVTATAP